MTIRWFALEMQCPFTVLTTASNTLREALHDVVLDAC